MSGHSKWATIKHKKGAADKARGKLFNKLARQIETAARAGGGDVETNSALRTAVQKARSGQMTNDAIDRAVKRGTGDVGGESFVSITYEGYAPGGVALLIDVLTDNRNRTGAEVRYIFSKLGGSMAEPGAVGWQFHRRGVLMVDFKADEESLMLAALEAGADDVTDEGGVWCVTCEPGAAFDIKAVLDSAGFNVLSADTPMVSENLVHVTDIDDVRKILKIMEAIDDNEDVQDVYSNFDISDEMIEAASA